MKALLLAAGKGTRLKPYTDTTPKCLIPIHDDPLLKIWIDLFERHQITEVLINTHHHANQVDDYISDLRNHTRVKLTAVYEQHLLGSGGTLLKNRDFFETCDDFVVAYADNLTDIDLKRMLAFHHHHRPENGILTLGLFRAPKPENCGIVQLDRHQRVIDFVEKPHRPASDLANAGIYVVSRQLFEYTSDFDSNPQDSHIDLGFHILPKLVGRMYGFIIEDYLRDIGTVESYHQALKEWPRKKIG